MTCSWAETVCVLPTPVSRRETRRARLLRRYVVVRRARAGAKRGASPVNITNDGWFLRSTAVDQHLANAQLRAVEYRRPLVRCTNTGVTCAIDAQGRLERWIEPLVEGVHRGQIKNAPPSPPSPSSPVTVTGGRTFLRP